MLFIGRIPHFSNRCCIHRGDSVTFIPVMRLAQYLGHRSGAAISTDTCWSIGGPACSYFTSGRGRLCLVRAAASLAMPSIQRQSGRLGVISASRIVSPRYSASGVPMGASAGKTIIPSWLSEMPSSFSEHAMPLETTPRILAGLRRNTSPLCPSISWAPT